MKKFVFTLLLGLILVACQAQDDRGPSKLELAERSTDSISRDTPKISWKVDKQYDEEGNVIGYDSIYSYSYSNLESLPKEMNLDSIMGAMKFFSEDNLYSFMEDHNLGRFMDIDSLMGRGPYFNDFFERQRNNNFSDMRKIFQQMDSLQEMMMERHRHFKPEALKEKSKL
ncbi:hypothetical protein QSE00_11080 [Arenibacter sp. M-2]|uniref:hypothetical protein n=1 Tax=Arenibacter sp. M-2 TaxID=3053612 RepID=UPI002570BDD8|nr:hypothetical protein [Arenibacter sp. M-2]MDL5512361.1 hypothetical protein [Arenibacter sp. M-2]|tara:strand:+ start:36908 stop:37417 length:510 start_codon:yes stop_codon:yes gene_type:complete